MQVITLTAFYWLYTAAGYITLVVFSVWSCGSHFSIFSCVWNMSSATDGNFFTLIDEHCGHAEQQKEQQKNWWLNATFYITKVIFTCSPVSQNGPCFVCPACSLICIKTQLRTTWRRNRKSSDLGKACTLLCYRPDFHLATCQPVIIWDYVHVPPTFDLP